MVTHAGTFQYKCMTYRLSGAPSTFSRLMDTVLSNLLNGGSTLVYLDDIFVSGRDYDEMLINLEKVLNRLESANLTLKPSKCSFGETQLKLLGHIISENGIQI